MKLILFNGLSKLTGCRRTMLSALAILCLTGLGIYKGMDVASSIAAIAMAVGAANAFQGVGEAKASSAKLPAGE